MDFLLGSDPELMLCDAKLGDLKSAIPVIQEGKGAGRPIDETGVNAVLHDNVLVEFNTAPAPSEEAFVSTIGSVLKNIEGIVRKADMRLFLRASADFPEEELNHPEARIFGCDPDFDAYLLRPNIVPPGAEMLPFRSTGGHLHIGKGKNEDINKILEDPYGKIDVVRSLDIFCGIPSVFLDKDPTAAARRKLYGGAGAHRPKPYGVEYRTLSSWWLATPSHTRLVYRLTAEALKCLVQGDLKELTEAIGQDEIISVINNSEVEKAESIFKEHIYPRLDRKTKILATKLSKFTFSTLQEGWKL